MTLNSLTTNSVPSIMRVCQIRCSNIKMIWCYESRTNSHTHTHTQALLQFPHTRRKRPVGLRLCQASPVNKEGKPWDWMQLVETRSAALNLSETDHPWVGRPNIHMRGCSRQLSEKNFIHSLADIRWAEFCVKMGMSYDQEDVPVGLFTDLRHGIDHQLRGGNLCLLGGSLAYWHARDRTCAPV